MKRLLFLLVLIMTPAVAATGQTKARGVLLEDLTWLEAEKILNEKTVVVIPVGAAA